MTQSIVRVCSSIRVSICYDVVPFGIIYPICHLQFWSTILNSAVDSRYWLIGLACAWAVKQINVWGANTRGRRRRALVTSNDLETWLEQSKQPAVEFQLCLKAKRSQPDKLTAAKWYISYIAVGHLTQWHKLLLLLLHRSCHQLWEQSRV